MTRGQFKNCPKVEELIAKNGGHNTKVSTNGVKVETSQNFYDLELVTRFPRCEKAND
jgi:hypothetical protein